MHTSPRLRVIVSVCLSLIVLFGLSASRVTGAPPPPALQFAPASNDPSWIVPVQNSDTETTAPNLDSVPLNPLSFVVLPSQLENTQLPNQQGTRSLTIQNTGDSSSLTWKMLEDWIAVNVTQSNSQTITALNSVSCHGDNFHTANSYFRVFNLPGMGVTHDLLVDEVQIGIEEANDGGGFGQPLEVRLYTLSGQLLWANLTPIAQQAIVVLDQLVTILSIPISAVVPAGSTLVVEIFTPDGQAASNLIFVGSNNLGETGTSYIAAADCGVPQPTSTSALGFPGMHIVMNVLGKELIDIPWINLGSPVVGALDGGQSDPGEPT